MFFSKDRLFPSNNLGVKPSFNISLSNLKLYFLYLCLLSTILLSPINILKAETTAKDQREIKKILEEIKYLKSRVVELDRKIIDSERSYSPTSYSATSNLKLYATLRLQFLYQHGNDSDVYKKLGGDLDSGRQLNINTSKLRVGGVNKVTDDLDFIFAIHSVGETLRFETLYFTYEVNENFLIDFGQTYIDNFIYGGKTARYDVSAMPNSPRFEKFQHLFIGTAIGLAFRNVYGRAGIYYGVFGNSIGDSINEKNRIITSARAYFVPLGGEKNNYGNNSPSSIRTKDDINLLHVGFGYYDRYEEFNNTVPSIPGIDATVNYYDMKNVRKSSVELAVLYNHFMMLYEGSRAYLTPAYMGYKDVKFDVNSFFIQTSVMLTGENYTYKYGQFGRDNVLRPVTAGGIGSFELAYRLAKTDFHDKAKGKELDYGNYREHIVSLNWGVTDYLHLLLSHSFIKEEFVGQHVVDELLTQNGLDKVNKYEVTQLNLRLFFY
jgi:hypothetical protein